ncbi:hypothetical protein C0991_009356 [Blastosporella zonata]|nr:hypothetical protein C0991_009356 [Blastosporella zonata]
MGLLANLPVGLAPGLGLNAYFAYSVVGFHGSGIITYGEALAAVFLEGWIFFFLSLLGLRQWLVRIMPQSLVLAVGAGIGLFIALLMLYRVRGAILIGIFLVSIISWPRPTPVTYFPHTDAGDALFDFFKKVVTFRPIGIVGKAIDFNYRNGKVWYALITFLYVDILDTTGTLYSMAKFAGLRDPVTLDFENSTIAYCVDAFCISMGALMGTSPVTSFVESATGISEGGKTGLTAMTTGLAFFVSVFFAPIFSSIPGWATGGALVIVGSLMIRNVKEINWNYIGDAVPAFLTLIVIPLTYNIAYGVIAGIVSYMLINGIALALRKISNDRIIPPNYYEESEEWVIPPGSIFPGWINVFRKKSDSDKVYETEMTNAHQDESSPKESQESEKKALTVVE